MNCDESSDMWKVLRPPWNLKSGVGEVKDIQETFDDDEGPTENIEKSGENWNKLQYKIKDAEGLRESVFPAILWPLLDWKLCSFTPNPIAQIHD